MPIAIRAARPAPSGLRRSPPRVPATPTPTGIALTNMHETPIPVTPPNLPVAVRPRRLQHSPRTAAASAPATETAASFALSHRRRHLAAQPPTMDPNKYTGYGDYCLERLIGLHRRFLREAQDSLDHLAALASNQQIADTCGDAYELFREMWAPSTELGQLHDDAMYELFRLHCVPPSSAEELALEVRENEILRRIHCRQHGSDDRPALPPPEQPPPPVQPTHQPPPPPTASRPTRRAATRYNLRPRPAPYNLRSRSQRK
jgi:hypothetical protein